MSTVAMDYCLVCGDEHVRHENKQAEFDVRGETVQIDLPVKICPACGTVEQTDVDPAELAFAAYRRQRGLLTPMAIKEVRDRFKLSQKSLAALLGMSEATINRYEGGGVQDEAHDQAIRSCATTEGMRDILQRRGDRLSDWQRSRVEDALKDESVKHGGILLEASRFYGMPQEKTLTTGFREFDYGRYAAVVVWFCRHMNPVTVTSLNKLLFYADFLHYRNESVSLTGAAYRRLPYGPVPAAYGDLRQQMEWGQIIEVCEVGYQNGNVGEEIRAGVNAEDPSSRFSSREVKTLQAVTAQFAKCTPSQISEYAHQESAWKDTEDRALISYDNAAHLSLSLNR